MTNKSLPILDLISITPLNFAQIYEEIQNKTNKGVGKEKLLAILNLLIEDHYLRKDDEANLYSWWYEPLRIIWQTKREPLL